jgi:hypothetical protein
LALRGIVRVDQRLLLLMWSLGERWGKVTRTGIRIDLPLRHQLIAELVGARRPTVTTALARLRARGLLERLPNRVGWLLCGEAPPAFFNASPVTVRTSGFASLHVLDQGSSVSRSA